METTNTPIKVIATSYKTTLAANGKDATVININVVDSQGREVPDANNLIHFSLNGDGRIIGVGNGDPSSHEPDKYFNNTDWKRSLFNGKCQVIIQTGKTSGTLLFEAKSNGLATGSGVIKTIQPNKGE